MGWSTTAVVVPFIVPNQFGPGGSHDPDMVDGVDLGKGWAFYPSCTGYSHHNNTIFCDEIIHPSKGTIFTVNESAYSSGGESWMCLFADTRKPLEEFLKDMGVTDATITDNDAVQQTA